MEPAPENRKIEIDQDGLKNLDKSRKWAMFLSVLGFICFGLLVIIGVIAALFFSTFKEGSQDSRSSELIILIIYIILAASAFLPVFFLFRFSKHIATALIRFDNKELNKAIRNLKSYFIYFGVLILVILAVYFAVLIGTGTSISLPKGLG